MIPNDDVILVLSSENSNKLISNKKSTEKNLLTHNIGVTQPSINWSKWNLNMKITFFAIKFWSRIFFLKSLHYMGEEGGFCNLASFPHM